jgi:hypothetical protein
MLTSCNWYDDCWAAGDLGPGVGQLEGGAVVTEWEPNDGGNTQK